MCTRKSLGLVDVRRQMFTWSSFSQTCQCLKVTHVPAGASPKPSPAPKELPQEPVAAANGNGSPAKVAIAKVAAPVKSAKASPVKLAKATPPEGKPAAKTLPEEATPAKAAPAKAAPALDAFTPGAGTYLEVLTRMRRGQHVHMGALMHSDTSTCQHLGIHKVQSPQSSPCFLWDLRICLPRPLHMHLTEILYVPSAA